MIVNMKVGILTFHRADNYGAILQCYALWRFLKNKNIDIEVIDYRNPKIEKWYYVFPYFEKNVFRWGKRILKRIPDYAWMYRRRRRFLEFRKMIFFSEKYSHKQLMNDDKGYDLIISGSDQLFNPDTTLGFDDVYFLMLPGRCIRSTYAVSLGNVRNEVFGNQDFLNRISKIKYMSVREKDAYDYLNSMGIKTRLDVDPTFLLGSEEWKKISRSVKINLPEEYIVLYYIQKNEDLITAAISLAKIKNIPILYFDHDLILPINSLFVGDQGPSGFLNIICNANYVVTSSFHATVFASIFNIELIMMLHTATGSRVRNLTDILRISDRIFTDVDDFNQRYNEKKMSSYEFIELERLVKNSKEYLDSLIKA